MMMLLPTATSILIENDGMNKYTTKMTMSKVAPFLPLMRLDSAYFTVDVLPHFFPESI